MITFRSYTSDHQKNNGITNTNSDDSLMIIYVMIMIVLDNKLYI